MNKYAIFGAAVAVTVGAALAISSWRYGGETVTAPATADKAAPSGAQPLGSRKPEAPSVAVQEATAPEVSAPFKYDHFRVGKRNIKAMLADGPIMWVGTSGGVIRYNIANDDYKLYNNKNGLLSNGVFHLGKVDGELWVGTYGGGLSILSPDTGKWRNYNIPSGMGDAFVYDALKASNGDVWIATWSGANRIPQGRMDHLENWELYTVENTKGGLANDWVYGLAEGRNGDIWLATEGGVSLYRNGVWRTWNHKDGLGADIETVRADIPFRNDPGTQSSHHATQKQEQGLGDVDIAYNPNYVISLVYDKKGRVWAGTWGAGLSMFDGETWKTYTKKDGLPANHVFMLYEDEDGMLWIGTNDGLARFDGTKFEKFTTRDGLFSNTVFSMDTARDGTMWVGSYGGVARFYQGLKPQASK
ncbi:MAG: regulator [Rhodospirillales bacterium CG15_BIG_FIL_POST_REV_8_21_14_020_66_15]|nr:MAG: regulator [Rhodospirillales bacterium CG15_BIG_FIL_POST_REV_8_21_14_020_66_15]